MLPVRSLVVNSRRFVHLPGKRQVEQAKQWIPSAAAYGSAAGAAVLYLTDWELVLQYVPFYNGKFVKSE